MRMSERRRYRDRAGKLGCWRMELTQEGVQWLADFDSRPVGSRTRMVELYIMIHGAFLLSICLIQG